MKVIGFTGESPVDGKHAGKDTAANFLREHMEAQGLNVRMGAWADKLKVSAARALGFTGTEQECIEYCDWFKQHGALELHYDMMARGARPDTDKMRGRISGREFLEYLGTEGGRDVHGADVWVDLALPAPLMVTSDNEAYGPLSGQFADVDAYLDTTTRFPNEVKRIREWKGYIIRIERPGVENPPGEHVSKYGIPRAECDAVVINDAGLDELRDRVVYAYDVLERHVYAGHPFVVYSTGNMTST